MALETMETLHPHTGAETACKNKAVSDPDQCGPHGGSSMGTSSVTGDVIPLDSNVQIEQLPPAKKEVPKFRLDQKNDGIATIEVEAPDGTDGLPLLKRILACEHDGSVDLLIQQLLLVNSHGPSVNVQNGNRALALIDEFAPRDALESTLATQMVAVHVSAMQCLRESADPNKDPEARNLALRHGERLTSVFVRQLEALDKHRRNGEQKVVVQHVTVDKGAQAIVGDVSVTQSGQGRSSGSEDQPRATG